MKGKFQKRTLVVLGIPYFVIVICILAMCPNTPDVLWLVGSLLFIPVALVYIYQNRKVEPTVNDTIEGPCVKEYLPLLEFARRYDRMKVGECTNHYTNTTFRCCIFIKDNVFTYVAFHRSLGVLSAEEISRRKNELKVGKDITDKYYLYAGKESFVQEVDLGL